MTTRNARLLDLYTDYLLASFGTNHRYRLGLVAAGTESRSGDTLPVSAATDRQRPVEDCQAASTASTARAMR